MDASMNASDVDARWVLVRIGAHEFAIDIMPVREVRGYTEPSFLPQAPRYVRGMIDLRGTAIPIVDLAEQLGLPPIVPTESSVVVVVESVGKLTGLLVDQVMDLLAMPPDVQPPLETGDCERRFVAGYAIVEGRILHLIALDNLLAWQLGKTAPAAGAMLH